MIHIYKSGFNANVNGSYSILGIWVLTASVGYIKFDIDEDYFNKRLDALGVTADVEVDAPVTIISVMVGVKYVLVPGSVKPYLAAELSFHNVSIDAQSVTVNEVKTPIQAEASETSAAWAIEGGVLIDLPGSIDLDINAKFNGNGTEIGQSSTQSSGNTTISESSFSTITFLTINTVISFGL